MNAMLAVMVSEQLDALRGVLATKLATHHVPGGK